jgi:hypothetical protein
MSDHDKTIAERDRHERTLAGHADEHGGHADEHGGHDDHHGVGAHEVDKMPSSRLFNLLFGLSGLTLVACIGVVQLFYRQVDTIKDTRDTKVSFQLAEYRAQMDGLRGGLVLDMTDDDGIPAAEGGKGVHEERRYQMPLAEARKRVLEQPGLLKAGKPANPRWRDPDANAPKPAMQVGPKPRPPARPPVQPGVDGRPAGVLPPGAVPGQPGRPGAMVPAEAPAEGKAPAKGEGKAEGKAPGKGEGKAGKGEGKAEGKAPAEGKANE